LVVIFAAALCLRLAFVAGNPHPASFDTLAANHGEIARNIVVHGRWFVVNERSPIYKLQAEQGRLLDPADVDYTAADQQPAYTDYVAEPPGEGLVLAGLWRLTGDYRYIYIQVLQAVLDSSMIFLIYWISAHLYRRPRAAVLAAAMYALFMPLAVLARIPHVDIWAGFAAIGSLALFVKAQEGPRKWTWLIATGVLVGIGLFFRPGLILLPVAFGLATLPWSGARRAVSQAVVPLAVALAVMTPWTIRNYVVFHAFVPIRTGVGINLWEGLGEVPNSFGAEATDENAKAQVRKTDPRALEDSTRADAILRRKAQHEIRRHPQVYLRAIGRRILRSTLWPLNSSTSVRKSLSNVASLAESALFVIAVLTAFCYRRFSRQNALVLAVAIANIFPYLFLHLETRYILAGIFAYMIIVSVAFELLVVRVLASRAQGDRETTLTHPERGGR